ncbi:ChrR family anti-sigma-E factor [Azospirillum halopraeferens]|uniref:ChrR family anti-sigma-E factor n=1 Tax=Azospirillum halopraeferens TaxID=34010 RepID=UPI0003FCA629|nr:ChrR family anti-sigma-E factor [Azospirillum halopraeferens]
MNGPSHHPDDDLLLAYAAGGPGGVKALLVATHLAFCPDCRRRVAAFEAECGAWLETLPPSDGTDDGLTALLARLDDQPRSPAPPVPASRRRTVPLHNPTIPEPLRSRLGGPVEGFAWTPVSEGVDLSVWSQADGGSSVCLLRMAAGHPVPPHHHTAGEMLLVLKGGFRDEYGHFVRGDVASYVGDSDHHAVADTDGECLCLFLLDGPIEFLDAPATPPA